jgi:GAF domain-containing protein
MLVTEQRSVFFENLNAPTILKSLLDEFSAVTDYRTLRDSLPRRLAYLLQCRCVLLYQRLGETLQFASGSFDEKPGWSSSLLEVAHINPISTDSDTPEALAWRSRHPITAPPESAMPTIVAAPLIYRQRAIGVLVAIRSDSAIRGMENFMNSGYDYWSDSDVQVIEVVAGVTAMLLENTRLLERDWERIHELSLLNSISSQLHRSMHKLERVCNIVVQRAREISAADLCELILPSSTSIPWISSTLHQKLLQHMNGQSDPLLSPLVIERPVDPASIHPISPLPPSLHNEYLSQLSGNIKTFFAIPLLSSDANSNSTEGGRTPVSAEARPRMLGILVGAYHRPWKLRHAELVLLQVLASQAGAILENISLMAEVV